MVFCDRIYTISENKTPEKMLYTDDTVMKSR